jgi:hypothetical protein
MYKASANLYAKVSFASGTWGAGNERKGVLDEEPGWKSKRLIRVPCVTGCACVVCWHEGNTEEEQNGYVVFKGKYNGGWRVGGVTPPLTLPLFTMLLHNGGFCNPIALQNGACTPFHTMSGWKVWNFYENYITLFCLEKNKLFDKI